MTDCKCGNNIKCELLAPAGSYDTMVAAFNAGADAVYVGGQKFGARAFAGNFDEEELVRAIRYAHLLDKKLYLTVNTLLKEEELDDLYDYLLPYYTAGLDAVIVQDTGVLKFISENFKNLPIHCSTQMTITGAEFGKILSQNKSVTRIVTPRELNLNEIRKICDETKLEIESFVHGALCYCYSGQCLLSSIIGARSGNRGRCAQPCRLTFSSTDLQVSDKHLLSPKDLCTLEILPDIIEAGVYSLKIEGRMKKPEYVAGVVAAYRKYLDLYLKKGRKEYKVDENDIDNLKEIYNRGGFTEGFYRKQNGSDMMTIDRSNHCGIKVGEVLSKNQNIIKIKAVRDIRKGDILEADEGTEFFAPYDIKKGTIFEYKFKQKVRFGNLKDIIRTRNELLIKNLLNKYMYDEKGRVSLSKRKVNIDVTIAGETNIVATMWDEKYSATVYGNVPLAAKNKPVKEESVEKQMKKLGDSCFCLDKLNVYLEEGLFVTVSELNELRRKLVLAYSREIEKAYERDKPYTRNNERLYDKHESFNGKNPGGFDSKLTVLVSDKQQFDKVASIYKGKRIYIEYANFSTEEIIDAINMGKEIQTEIFIALPYIFRDVAKTEVEKEAVLFRKIVPDGYLFRNLESYFYFINKKLVINKAVFDSNIYSFNNAAIKYYKELGAELVTASYETNFNEYKHLDISDMEINIYGYFPVMVSAGCVRKTVDKCLKRSGTFMNAENSLDIIDRKSSCFKVKTVCRYCYNIIYNSVPIGLFSNTDELENLNFAAYRINFTFESPKEIENILLKHDTFEKSCTKGHFKRGVE